MKNLAHSKIKNIIFDLDGTLIDSAPSILTGLEIAIKKYGLLPVSPLSPSLIGPPLRETLKKIVGDQEGVDLDILVSDFKLYYDSEGFKFSILYPGVQALLNELVKLGISIYLATNKRFQPTLKIVEYFGWASTFNEVYAIDKFIEKPYTNKALMIQGLIEVESIDHAHTIYVGDRIEDLDASLESGINAILVKWGYGDFDSKSANEDARYVDSTGELLQMIMGWQ